MSESVLVVSSNRTGSEKMGVLAIENGQLVLFDIALDEQIRPMKEQFTLDESKETAEVGKAWIDSIPEFDFATMESATNKNYNALISGEEIVVETKAKQVKTSAKEMFQALSKTGTTKTDKAEEVVKDLSSKKVEV